MFLRYRFAVYATSLIVLVLAAGFGAVQLASAFTQQYATNGNAPKPTAHVADAATQPAATNQHVSKFLVLNSRRHRRNQSRRYRTRKNASFFKKSNRKRLASKRRKFDRSLRSGLTRGPKPYLSPWGSVYGRRGIFQAGVDDDGFLPPRRRTYRTVCVRLCDGSYFPISAATPSDRFAADEAQCKSSCSSPARLFSYPSSGGTPDDMKDRRGKPYAALKNAYLYRTTYDAACTCKPQPWSKEAKNQHKLYALEESQRAGNKLAAAQIEELKAANPNLKVHAQKLASLRKNGRKKKSRGSKFAYKGQLDGFGLPLDANQKSKKKRRWKKRVTTRDIFRNNLSPSF